MGMVLIKQLLDIEQKLNEYEFLISIIAYFIAPTIEGKKPSSLVTFSKDKRNLYRLWEKYKDKACSELRVDYYEVCIENGYITVLFYNTIELEAYINAKTNARFLEEFGYTKGAALEENLRLLRYRFKSGCPHEIGIFLGIPLDDVIGFIKNEGKNCLMCGYWKVYSSTKRAKTYFDLYDKSRIHIVSTMLGARHVT